MHLLFGRMRVIDSSLTYRTGGYANGEVYVFDSVWWYASLRYMFGVLTHTILYMLLAKWIAVYFSLRFNSQMKAMLGTILSIVGIVYDPRDADRPAHAVAGNESGPGGPANLVLHVASHHLHV